VVYRLKTIRIIQEIDNLEFCLNALVQDINNKLNSDKEFLSIIFY
jgi:nucleoside-triphosphatase THEP1